MNSDNFTPAVGAVGIVTRGLVVGAVTSAGCGGGVARCISSRKVYVPNNIISTCAPLAFLHRTGNLHTFANLKSCIWAFGMSQDIAGLYGKWHSICCGLSSAPHVRCRLGGKLRPRGCIKKIDKSVGMPFFQVEHIGGRCDLRERSTSEFAPATDSPHAIPGVSLTSYWRCRRGRRAMVPINKEISYFCVGCDRRSRQYLPSSHV